MAYTANGRPILVDTVRPVTPWELAYGSWAERARIG